MDAGKHALLCAPQRAQKPPWWAPGAGRWHCYPVGRNLKRAHPPLSVLLGDDSVGEFHSVALTHHRQQADTGTKMIHVGKRTKSKIVSKGISAGHGQNTYRGLVKVDRNADGARNYTQCDSLLIGKKCGAHTFPYIEVKNPGATVEHEATTSKISDDQLFYCRARGIDQENAVSMIVDGFCKQVFRELPMEFAVEAKKLLEVSLEGSVG